MKEKMLLKAADTYGRRFIDFTKKVKPDLSEDEAIDISVEWIKDCLDEYKATNSLKVVIEKVLDFEKMRKFVINAYEEN